MNFRLSRLPSPALVIAVIALFAALGGGLAYAQGGGGEPARLTRACVDNGTQILRLTRIDRCPAGSHLVSWGERGAQGRPGPGEPEVKSARREKSGLRVRRVKSGPRAESDRQGPGARPDRQDRPARQDRRDRLVRPARQAPPASAASKKSPTL